MRQLISSIGIISLFLAATAPAVAGDFSFKPYLAVAEEFTDNAREVNAPREHDFITRATPGFSTRYASPLWEWNASYTFDYRYYIRGTRGDDTTHALDLKGNIFVIRNLLFLEVSDVYKRVSLDVARDTTADSLFRNQVESNVATVSPYVVVRFRDRTELRGGYRFTDTRYFSPEFVDAQPEPLDVRDRTTHALFISASHAVTPRSFLTADYQVQREFVFEGDSILHTAQAGWRAAFAEKSSLKLLGGYSRIDFEGPRGSSDSATWSAAVDHEAGVMKYVLVTGVNFVADPLNAIVKETFYRGEVVRKTERNTFSIKGAYSDFDETSNGQTVPAPDLVRGDRKNMSIGLAALQALSPSLAANVSLSGDRLLRKELPRSDRVIADAGLTWDAGTGLKVRGYWSHVQYFSRLETEERSVNRVGVEVRKEFGV